VSHIIFADFTIWRWILAGLHGPSSQNEHGPKSKVEVKERLLSKNMQQSSLRKKMPNAGLITSCCMKPGQPKPTPPASPLKMLIGKTACSFTGEKNSDR
jgi:hypothetical protein